MQNDSIDCSAEELSELRDFYEHAPCGLCTLSGSGRIRRINHTLAQWLGLPVHELRGVHDFAEFLSEASRGRFTSAVDCFSETGRIDQLELELAAKGQPLRFVQVSAMAALDEEGGYRGVRVVVYDATETHRLKQELTALNAEQLGMLNSDLVGILRVQGRRIVWKNATVELMLGYERDELLGKDTGILFADPAVYRKVVREAYARISAGELYRNQVRLRRKDGRFLWVNMNGTQSAMGKGEALWVIMDITILKEYQQQVEQLAFHDALTGLPNRLLLSDRMKHAFRQADRSGHCVAVCYMDLDGFKPVNDTHGHDAGDRLLKVLAERLSQTLRAGDTVARLGGDEFALVAPMEKPEHHEQLTQRVLDVLCQPVRLGNGLEVSVSGSIGVALYPLHGKREMELLTLADKALYRAKKAGRARAALAKPLPVAKP
jgi:diguanylate cyclase (GGDEF)-like protein/PAS domain S-box-containing protein